MPLNLPSLKPRPEASKCFVFDEDEVGLGNISQTAARTQIGKRHPLEHVLKNKMDHELALQRSVLFNVQGPAGPMIQAMELRAASSVGRLPFLSSSNFQRDVLTGKDEEIDFEDVFGVLPRWGEQTIQPHAVMEKFKPNFAIVKAANGEDKVFLEDFAY